MAIKRKIILLGDSAVGKTSLIRRFVFDKFEDTYITTIGSKVTRKELSINRDGEDVNITLMIWDILGRSGYTASHSRMFAGAHGAIIVADLTRKETLENIEHYWIPLLFEVVENVPLVFACNKSDLKGEMEFKPEDMIKIAARYNYGLEDVLPKPLITSYSTSAKTGDNVELAFESLGHMAVSDRMLRDPIKELYESLVAEGIYRQTDKTTLIGATDAIIVDFCQGFEDDRLAMSLLRQEIVRAGIDIRAPSKEGLLKVVEYLAEAESEFHDGETVRSNIEKRQVMVKKVE